MNAVQSLMTLASFVDTAPELALSLTTDSKTGKGSMVPSQHSPDESVFLPNIKKDTLTKHVNAASPSQAGIGNQDREDQHIAINPQGSLDIKSTSSAGIPKCLESTKSQQTRDVLDASPPKRLHQQGELQHTILEVNSQMPSARLLENIRQPSTDVAANDRPDQLTSFINTCRSASLDIRSAPWHGYMLLLAAPFPGYVLFWLTVLDIK